MSVYFEYLMDLWRKDPDEFIQQAPGLLEALSPEEKDRAQGALNFFVFAVLAVSSLASGVLVTTSGWFLLNLGSLIPVALTGASLVWLARKNRSYKYEASLQT